VGLSDWVYSWRKSINTKNAQKTNPPVMGFEPG